MIATTSTKQEQGFKNSDISQLERANNFLIQLRESAELQSTLFHNVTNALEHYPDRPLFEIFKTAIADSSGFVLPEEVMFLLVKLIDDSLYSPANGGVSDDELAVTFASNPYAKSGLCTLLTQCSWETNVCNTTTCFACS